MTDFGRIPELRFYCFINFYLSSIQQGIQTGHASIDLTARLLQTDFYTDAQTKLVREWAEKHKTYISLNGGNHRGIMDATALLERNGHWPFARFFESEDALGGLQTCVGVVLPDFVFNAQYDREMSRKADADIYTFTHENGVTFHYTPGHRDYELIKLLKACRLAS
jgi:hypothetical protein